MAADAKKTLVVEIEAELAKAKRDVEKFEKQLAGLDTEIPVSLDADEAKRDIDGLLSKVDKLGGEAAMILLRTNADDIATDIARLIGEIDQLDASDPSVDVKATQVAELSADLDRIAGKVKEVNATPIDLDTAGARQGLGDLNRSADSSKSVLANMIGNTTQDLGAMGGVAGSTGVAIGQMGEYMADALASGQKLSTVMSSFGKIALPIAGLTAVTTIFNHMQQNAEKARRKTEELREAQEALAEGSTADFVEQFAAQNSKLILELEKQGVSVDELMEHLDAGTAGWGGLADEAGDFFLDLVQLQGRWDANTAAIGRNDEATRLVAEAMGMVVSATGEIVAKEEALAKGVDGVAEALGGVVDETGKVTTATQRRAAAALSAAKADEEQVKVLQDTVEALQGEKEALEKSIDAIHDRIEAQRNAADATLDVHEAEDTWLDTLTDLPKKLDDIAASEQSHEGIIRDTQEAYNDAARSAAAMADAAVAQAEIVAQASGSTLTAAERMDTFNERMLDAASNAGAGGPVEKAILDYIATVNKIDPEKVTEISAALAEGDLEEANRLLDEASQTRVASIEADANVEALNRTTEALDNLADAIRTATILTEADTTGATDDVDAWADHFKRNPIQIPVTPVLQRIAGLFGAGSVLPGPTAGGLAVLPAAAPAALAAGPAVAPATMSAPAVTNRYSINVQVPPTVNPAEIGERIVEAIKQYERRSGKGWRVA